MSEPLPTESDSSFESESSSKVRSRSNRPLVLAGFVVAVLMIAICGGGVAFLSQTTRPGTRLVYVIESGEVDAQDVVPPVRTRLRDVFPYGVTVTALDSNRMEVVLPTADRLDVDYAKRLISSGGNLRFLILANDFNHQHLLALVAGRPTVDPTSDSPPSRDVKDDLGNVVARWVTATRQQPLPNGGRPLHATIDQAVVRDSKTGKILELPPGVLAGDTPNSVAAWMDTQGIESIDLLAVVDPTVEVSGDDLTFAASTFDQNGQPAVAIVLSDAGGARFYALTLSNEPRLGRSSKLAIVLDDQVLSSPNILSAIRKEARITGRFTQQEVDFMVTVLKSGAMPSELSDQPITEEAVEVSIGLLDRFGL